jgi:ferredoxin
MRVLVDRDVCFGHARCFAHCPEVFGLDEEGHAVVVVSEVPADLQERAGEAARLCPENAITVSE